MVNIVLSIFKFLAGLIGHSSAMISDSIHSLSDVISTIIVIIGVKLSNKQADNDHPYGHEKIECIATITLAIILSITGITIGYSGIINIVNSNYKLSKEPSVLALSAAIISIIVKEAMYWYTRYYAKKIKSNALMADAWHHRSDALSSVGSFIGILFSLIGFKIFDPVASIIICIFIVKVGIDIFLDASSKLVDKSCDSQTIISLKETIMENKEVIAIDSLMTRLFGNKVYIDVEIRLNGDLKLNEAHDIAESVEKTIEDKFSDIKHCMIHINPN